MDIVGPEPLSYIPDHTAPEPYGGAKQSMNILTLQEYSEVKWSAQHGGLSTATAL